MYFYQTKDYSSLYSLWVDVLKFIKLFLYLFVEEEELEQVSKYQVSFG